MLVQPTSKELQTGRTNNHISRIFFMLTAEKEDGGKIKRQKDIDHHSPK
jgi:hypothetical protein